MPTPASLPSDLEKDDGAPADSGPDSLPFGKWTTTVPLADPSRPLPPAQSSVIRSMQAPLALDYVNDPNGYYRSSTARSQWIALWVLFLVWTLAWLARKWHQGTATATPEMSIASHPAMVTAQATETEFSGEGIRHRLRKADHIARDLMLILLVSLVVNAVARASATAVGVLAWIYMALAMVWVVYELAVDRVPGLIKLLFGLTFTALALAMWIIAFASGFPF